ncbi:MAG TPA: DUF4129 domain-containing protein [Candidatus Angelobacter sp.]|nr:DUF4129 domain-containing protein [Candidatus Angelobacter sp.]
MKSRNAIVSFLLFALLWAFAGTTAQAESISVAEYRAQLRDIAAKIAALGNHPEQAGKAVAEIPDQTTVTTGAGNVTVNYKNLKDDLAAFSGAEQQKRPALLSKIQSYVQTLSAAADAYEQSATDLPSARAKLDQILSRHEFNKVKGPTAKDTFLSKVYRWLSRMLNKLSFGKGSRFDFFELFIYLLVGAAVSILLIWTLRRLRRPREELPQREVIPFAPSARSWRAWLADARSLAAQQDWRNAIHMAYWAGISYLEEHGAWKPNRARTPREYLRLVGARAAQYPVLAALTRKLELVWYGYGTARQADFEETLGQLEQLGCR